MKNSELTDDALLVLIGAARAIINADAVLSLDEVGWVRTLITEIGRERWRGLAERADHEFLRAEELVDALERLPSAEVRAWIRGELRRIAEMDGLEPAEISLLRLLEGSED
jgi:hypothetical protein